jgi:hypothetical protein
MERVPGSFDSPIADRDAAAVSDLDARLARAVIGKQNQVRPTELRAALHRISWVRRKGIEFADEVSYHGGLYDLNTTGKATGAAGPQWAVRRVSADQRARRMAGHQDRRAT